MHGDKLHRIWQVPSFKEPFPDTNRHNLKK